MVKKRLLFTCFVFISFLGCTGKLPVIGIDEDGKVQERFINEKTYSSRLNKALHTTSKSVLPALAKLEMERSDWKMDKLRLGIGIKAEAGIGPFKAGVNPRVRVTYKSQ